MQLSKKSSIISLGVLAVLMIIFSFTDLAISQAIYNPDSIYGKFFAAFGEVPGMIVGVFSVAALFITRDQTVKWKSVSSGIGYGVLLAMLGVMSAMIPFNYIDGINKKIVPFIVVPLAIIIVTLCMYFANKIKPEQRAALRRAAIIGVLTFLCAIIIVNIIKNIWGRPRFRSMDDPINQFVAWYLPQGLAKGEEFRSFPSGHSANSAIIIWLSLLPSFIPALKGKEKPLFIGAFAWAILVMFSRVVMGAHFASDVTIGVTITIVSFMLLCKAFKPVKSIDE